MTLKTTVTQHPPKEIRQEALRKATDEAWQDVSRYHPDFFEKIAQKTISDLKQWYPPLVPNAHPELRNALISFFPLLKPVFDGIDLIWDLGKRLVEKK